ncbi:MAG: GNAT family N-acetyltransferase [Bacteroidota bacterium]
MRTTDSMTIAPSQLQLRLIQKTDNAIVAKIIRETMTQFGCVGEGYAYVDPEIDDIYTAFNEERTRFWVLENEQGKVIGCGGIAPLKNGAADTCELQKLYFLEEARGKGFGRKLTELCLQTAKELGYKKCYLETVERMTAANAMYQKMGFEKLCGNMGDTGHCSCDSYYVKML